MTTQRIDARSIETRTSWVVASVSLILLGLSFGGPWITAVGLKEIASDTTLDAVKAATGADLIVSERLTTFS